MLAYHYCFEESKPVFGTLSASCFPRLDLCDLHVVALREMAIGLDLDSGEKGLDQRECLAGTRLARMDGSARFHCYCRQCGVMMTN